MITPSALNHFPNNSDNGRCKNIPKSDNIDWSLIVPMPLINDSCKDFQFKIIIHIPTMIVIVYGTFVLGPIQRPYTILETHIINNKMHADKKYNFFIFLYSCFIQLKSLQIYASVNAGHKGVKHILKAIIVTDRYLFAML